MNHRLVTVSALSILLACAPTGPSTPAANQLNFSIYGGSYFYPSDPPHIALVVRTEETYPCTSYLESTLSVSGDVVRVDLSGTILKPDNCYPAEGPAFFSAPLQVTNGTYALQFRRGGVTDRYRVTITDTTIYIAPVETHFTHPTALRFYRD